MTRRIKAQGPATAKSKTYLIEYAEHGYGMPISKFNKIHGYGQAAHRRWSVDIVDFREKFEALKFGHEQRAQALGPSAVALPPSHTEELNTWQQNFLEAWRRTKSELSAASTAKVSWSEVRHSLETDEAFAKAYEATKEELLQGVRDAMMVGAYEGKVGHAQKVLAENEVKNNEDGGALDWWNDPGNVAECFR